MLSEKILEGRKTPVPTSVRVASTGHIFRVVAGPAGRVEDGATAACLGVGDPPALSGTLARVVGGALPGVGHHVVRGRGAPAQGRRVLRTQGPFNHHRARLRPENHLTVAQIHVLDGVRLVGQVEVLLQEDVGDLGFLGPVSSTGPGGRLGPHDHHAARLEPHVAAELVGGPGPVVIGAAEVVPATVSNIPGRLLASETEELARSVEVLTA